jgi:hypothetical protein
MVCAHLASLAAAVPRLHCDDIHSDLDVAVDWCESQGVVEAFTAFLAGSCPSAVALQLREKDGD